MECPQPQTIHSPLRRSLQGLPLVNLKKFVRVAVSSRAVRERESYTGRFCTRSALQEDMLAGSMDASATSVEWALSELIKHPRVMKKLQTELETVVGMKRKVEESDLDKLEYLDMVIKESLRFHRVAPLLIPHQSMEDCMVGDFFIPKQTRVIVNAWAIMRDPSAWNEPEKFWPERFEGSNGLQLGLTVVRLVVAQLVHCFDWKLPNDMKPTDMDMTEEFGLTKPRAKHLVAIPIYRLQNEREDLGGGGGGYAIVTFYFMLIIS
ncbi:cytochrome P450 71AU50-like [Gastrolobium bilobum]|uniref:cytochrome P450 71AU50-like n=1 Tax=Gastrolobium bilobum TaxID=150636 RepID=UPI002AB26CD0|nr:cytochrome P450 71AU50-like [Gastrolobium bilobum]